MGGHLVSLFCGRVHRHSSRGSRHWLQMPFPVVKASRTGHETCAHPGGDSQRSMGVPRDHRSPQRMQVPERPDRKLWAPRSSGRHRRRSTGSLWGRSQRMVFPATPPTVRQGCPTEEVSWTGQRETMSQEAWTTNQTLRLPSTALQQHKGADHQGETCPKHNAHRRA